MPRVSVIIATHNRAGYLREAIESVLAQSYRDFELIVVDDGSSDETREVVDSYGDRACYLYRENGGECAARNSGLARARGEYIALLDDDDLFLPHKLECQVAALEQLPEAGMACSGTRQFLDGGRERAAGASLPVSGPARLEDVFGELLLWNRRVSVPGVLIRRACLDRVGPFDERLVCAGDEEMWLRISAEHPVAFSEPVVALVRSHSRNVGKAGCVRGWYIEARSYVTAKVAANLPPRRRNAAVQELLGYRKDLIELERFARLLCLGERSAALGHLEAALAEKRWARRRARPRLGQLGPAIAMTTSIYGNVFDAGDPFYAKSTQLLRTLWEKLPPGRRYLRAFLAGHLAFRHAERASRLLRGRDLAGASKQAFRALISYGGLATARALAGCAFRAATRRGRERPCPGSA
jgi:glycosyltransferase involved in cell wall biosynthesis